jgi:hypothetical protein
MYVWRYNQMDKSEYYRVAVDLTRDEWVKFKKLCLDADVTMTEYITTYVRKAIKPKKRKTQKVVSGNS